VNRTFKVRRMNLKRFPEEDYINRQFRAQFKSRSPLLSTKTERELGVELSRLHTMIYKDKVALGRFYAAAKGEDGILVSIDDANQILANVRKLARMLRFSLNNEYQRKLRNSRHDR
jgi:hypothetical protein